MNGASVYVGRARNTVLAGRASPVVSWNNGNTGGLPANANGSLFWAQQWPRPAGICAPITQCCCAGPVDIAPGEIMPLMINWAQWIDGTPGFVIDSVYSASLVDPANDMRPADPRLIKVVSGFHDKKLLRPPHRPSLPARPPRDYADASNWHALSVSPTEPVDAFVLASQDWVTSYDGIWTGIANPFAPRFRDRADAMAAMAYYLENYNDDRPFFIIGAGGGRATKAMKGLVPDDYQDQHLANWSLPASLTPQEVTSIHDNIVQCIADPAQCPEDDQDDGALHNADVAPFISLVPPYGTMVMLDASFKARVGSQFKLDICLVAHDCDGRRARQCQCVVIVVAEC